MRVLKTLPLLFLVLLLAACGAPAESAATPGLPQPEADAQATPGLPPGSLPSLTVCMGDAPTALHPYAAPNIWSRLFQEAIYPAAFYVENNTLQPGLLASLPSLADGSAVITPVPVAPGDMVVTAEGTTRPLDLGVLVRPAACNSADCAIAYTGEGPFLMDQLQVTFTLQPGLTWGDGAPVTADDSVYAFELNTQNLANSGNNRPTLTARYEATSASTAVWTGLPGAVPRSYMTYFWQPLPRHLWDGEDVFTATGARLDIIVPSTYGPYQLENWDEDTFTLYPTPNYAGAEPGTRFAPLVFQVVGTDGEANLARLLSGECDVLDPSTLAGVTPETLQTLAASGRAKLLTSNAGAWELLYFGITPRSYDDGYAPATDRPNFFGDVRTRQALAHCLDRNALLAATTAGQGAILHTYLPDSHALFNPAAAQYPYDPAAAAALLEEAGWVAGADGQRSALGIADIPDGTPFSIGYAVVDNPINRAVATQLVEDLRACGIGVEVTITPRDQYYATGEASPVFGRTFDLAQYTWAVDNSLEPSCHLFLGYTIPGPESEAFPLGWNGWNVTGWQSAEFDDSCQTARNALPGQQAHGPLHLAAQEIFAAELPAIPLFTYTQFALTRPDVCGLQLEGLTGLLYGWDEARRCTP